MLYPRGFIDHAETTTRHVSEVQDTDAEKFGRKLRRVFEECRRVLRDEGLLVFTYHHSRSDGWAALAEAIYGSGFSVVQAHPVKAELALATPKSQAKAPVLIDAILVCRKRKCDDRTRVDPPEAVETALAVATTQLQRLTAAGHKATEGDKFVLMLAQFFVALGPEESGASARRALSQQEERLRILAEALDACVSNQNQQQPEPADPSEGIQYILPL